MSSDNFIKTISLQTSLDPNSLEFAKHLDSIDPLKQYRSKFEFPVNDKDEQMIYMNGNSLGLMPKSAQKSIESQMTKWRRRANRGHFEEPLKWLSCDEYLVDSMSMIVGAKKSEVAMMNQLTVNLHLMLMAFYKPTQDRYKILCEYGAFPSDHYAFQSQIDHHGYDPDDALMCLKPRSGELTWRQEDIEAYIKDYGHEVALICFSGLHYFSGQLFNIKKITEIGHEKGCVVGWDLAHAVGNVELHLHDWNVDFAVWCSYKYLNSGPGGIGGIFVHEKHMKATLGYMKGWWGHKLETRMNMTNQFEEEHGALRFRLSNTSFTAVALANASLEIFQEVGDMKIIRDKSVKLTNYLEYLLKEELVSKGIISIITPENVTERGAQLSLQFHQTLNWDVEELLCHHGVLVDIRKPSILRVAPAPLYNSFQDVFELVQVLKRVFGGDSPK